MGCKTLEWRGVLLAGGKGLRAEPLTSALPKALLTYRERPVIDRLLDEMINAGITTVYIALKHMAKQIEGYLRLTRSDLDLRFIHEPKAMGTAGSLRELPGESYQFLVCNSHICSIKFMAFHHLSKI